MATDIMLDENNDLKIMNGDFVVGESTMQEVKLILQLNQGELKSDPILGPNLFTLLKTNGNNKIVSSIVRRHLARDNKNYDDIKNAIQINVEN